MNDKVKIIVASGYAEMVRGSALSLRLVKDELDELTGKLQLGSSESGERVASSPSKDQILDGILKIQELTEDLATKQVEYAANYKEFRDAAENIDPEPKCALVYHYLMLLNWKQVASKMGYTYDGIMDVRKRGLIQIYDYIPVEYRDVLPRAL